MRLFLLLSFVLLAGCQTLPLQTEREIQHVVLVWFNEDVSDLHIQQVVEQSYGLQQKIPQLKSIRIGEAIESDRPMVDDSFDIGLVMGFDSLADLREYEQHSDHKAFLGEYIKGRVAKIKIYDF